jgi:hypothetical protein
VSVRATTRLLGLTKNTVNLAILKVGEHCQKVYGSLMRDLKLNEVQLDELWTFVKKNGYCRGGTQAGPRRGLGLDSHRNLKSSDSQLQSRDSFIGRCPHYDPRTQIFMLWQVAFICQ